MAAIEIAAGRPRIYAKSVSLPKPALAEALNNSNLSSDLLDPLLNMGL